ncbi:MAG: uncharacterized protein A8A55_3489, partial [Amphiamblys sp. WSBS2006]
LSVFLSGCTEAAGIRVTALTVASIHTAAELRASLCSHEKQLEKAVAPGQEAIFRREVEIYSLALAAKEAWAWEKTPSFKKMVPFPPFNAGDNPEIMKNLFTIATEEVDVTESVSLEYIKGIYATWKKNFLGLMKKVPEPSERELQVSFARLLCFLSVEENDVRQFVELTDLEGDIMVHKDFVFVEIKKIEEFTMPLPVQQEE